MIIQVELTIDELGMIAYALGDHAIAFEDYGRKLAVCKEDLETYTDKCFRLGTRLFRIVSDERKRIEEGY